MRRGASARAAATTPQTINAYIKEHPEFAQEVEQAEMDACDVVEDALRTKALEGNVTAILVWLYNRSGGRWTDRRNHAPSQSELKDGTDSILKAIEERLKNEKKDQ